MIDTGLRTIGKFSVALLMLGATTASAATSFSNPLTGFTGDSTQATTQAALAAAGFDLFDILATNDNGTPEDPADDYSATVTFDAGGVHFGTLSPGDSGRNYMRTTQSDFATDDFTAEVTFVAPDLAIQDVFFGVGAGDRALFGWPDWSTQFSSVLVLPEITDAAVSQLTTFVTHDDSNAFADNPAPTMLNGTHRVRLEFDATAQTAIFSVDVNYAGGAFVADATAATVDVSLNFGETGWPGEPSKIFFGGDDGVVVKDFSVTVGNPPNANFNGDDFIDGKDYLIWQAGFGLTTGATLAQGNANGDDDVDADDFAAWKAAFGNADAVASAGAVPEPTAVALVALGLTLLSAAARRKE
jgi:hypothetical protein